MNAARTGLALFTLAALVLIAGCAGDPAFTSGKVYLQQQDYENAIKNLKTAIKNNPSNWEPHVWLGRTYAETDELELASEEFHAALELAPDEKARSEAENGIAYYAQKFRNEGNNFMDADQYEEAVNEYEKAIVIDPNHPDSRIGLGAAYQNMGDFDAAIEQYEMAYELRPDVPAIKDYVLRAYDVKAGSLDAVDDWAGAIEYYEKIQQIDPDYPNIDYNLGYMHYLLEHWRKALTYLEKHLENEPDDIDALQRTYYAYWKLADEIWETDPELATEYYQKVITALYKLIDEEDTVSYHRMLQRIFLKLGREEEAQAELEQVRMLLDMGGQ
ncbi:MAG: tetratricopeptide repeat protein [Candidatus Eisenbacteria bacterium]|nr:tetratricopeptide repeat protein [Candidatus Eisenbacteria bacterium]